MKSLRISDDLSLPLDFVTERIAFLARTGAGKSGGMRVLFEAFLDAGQFVIFIDPKGDAYGVRAAGVGPGYPVLVMGGDHGDVPLESSAGKVVAEFLVKERVSTVLDVSDFGKADMVRFVTDLASTLYRRNRDVVHVFLDEADMVAGEKFYDPKCLEAIQLIQNKGRHRGFGVTIATQRSAMVNKTVLYASGTLVAMQTTSPKDIRTIRDWLEVVATPEAAKGIVSALPTLKTREALVYSPQYLGSEAARITFKTFRTFDSMRTPKPGEARQQPKSLADIDLSTVQKDMAATIEKFKAEDPRELKKQITELKRQVASKAPAPAKAVETIKTVEKLVLKDAQIKRMEFVCEKLSTVGTQLVEVAREITAEIKKFSTNGHRPVAQAPRSARPPVERQPHQASARRVTQSQAGSNPGDAKISSSQQRILNALAWLESVGLSPVIKKQVALMAGQSPTSGGFFNNLGSLRSAGLIDYPALGSVSLTDSGRNAASYDDAPTTNEELQQQVCAMVTGSQASILKELISSYPDALAKSDLAGRVGQSPTSGGYFNNLGRLRSLGMIDYPQSGYAVASAVLFLE